MYPATRPAAPSRTRLPPVIAKAADRGDADEDEDLEGLVDELDAAARGWPTTQGYGSSQVRATAATMLVKSAPPVVAPQLALTFSEIMAQSKATVQPPPVAGDAAAGALAAAAGAAAAGAASSGTAAAAVAPPPPQGLLGGTPPVTALTPSLQTLLAALGTTAATAGPVAGASSGRNAATERALLQLDSRQRTVEHILFDAVLMPSQHPAVVAGEEALTMYNARTQLSPAGHGLGGSEGVVGGAFLNGMCRQALPDGSDDGIQARMAGVAMLCKYFQDKTPITIGRTIKHFTVVQLQGDRVGTALVIFHLQGRISLPTTPQDLQTAKLAVDSAFSSSTAELDAMIGRAFSNDYGEILPAGDRSISLNKMLLAVLCSTGGVRPDGRAPRGGAFRNFKGKGKGRGRGRGGR